MPVLAKPAYYRKGQRSLQADIADGGQMLHILNFPYKAGLRTDAMPLRAEAAYETFDFPF